MKAWPGATWIYIWPGLNCSESYLTDANECSRTGLQPPTPVKNADLLIRQNSTVRKLEMIFISYLVVHCRGTHIGNILLLEGDGKKSFEKAHLLPYL